MVPTVDSVREELQQLLDLEARQEAVLEQLDDLNRRIERTLREVQGQVRLAPHGRG